MGNIPEVLENENILLNAKQTCESAQLFENSIIETNTWRPSQTENMSPVSFRSANNNSAIHPLISPDIKPLNIDKNEFIELQKNCSSLAKIRESANLSELFCSRNGRKCSFIIENNLLYRKCVKSKNSIDIGKLTLIVPQKFRTLVFKVALDLPISGDSPFRKTRLKVFQTFWWPGISGCIRCYCHSFARHKFLFIFVPGKENHGPAILSQKGK